MWFYYVFGNIIGSNIVNLLLILGIGALMHPITVPAALMWAVLPLLVFTTLILVAALSREWKLHRSIGFVFVTLYCVFLYVAWNA